MSFQSVAMCFKNTCSATAADTGTTLRLVNVPLSLSANAIPITRLLGTPLFKVPMGSNSPAHDPPSLRRLDPHCRIFLLYRPIVVKRGDKLVEPGAAVDRSANVHYCAALQTQHLKEQGASYGSCRCPASRRRRRGPDQAGRRRIRPGRCNSARTAPRCWKTDNQEKVQYRVCTVCPMFEN